MIEALLRLSRDLSRSSRRALRLTALCLSLSLVLPLQVALAQATFESDAGAGGCDGAWTTQQCWNVTSGSDNGDGYPSAANETSTILEGDVIEVNTPGLTVGTITTEDTDADPTDSGLQVFVGSSNTFDIAGSVDNQATFTIDANLSGQGNASTTGGFINSGRLVIGNRTMTIGTGLSNSGTVTADEGGVLEIRGNFSNTGALSFANVGTGSTVFLNGDFLSSGSAQTMSGNFVSGNSLSNLRVGPDARVDPADDLTQGNSKAVTIEGSLTVDNGGQYGVSGEGSDVDYQGFSFSIVGSGSFFADELNFNNPGSDSGNSVSASGEVFSLVRLTGGTFVELSSQFIINGLLVIDSSDELFLASGGSLVLNDDFENNGTYTPNTRSTIFSGQTDTGTGDPSSGGCNGVETNDGDCEQDVRGSGALDFGPVQVDRTNTRVILSTDNENPDVPNVTDLTIDPSDDDANVQLILNNTNLEISGDLVNNGIFGAGTRKVTFNGGSDQDIISSSPLDFFSLSIANSASGTVDVLLNSDAQVTVTDTLEIIQGGLGFTGSATNASLEIQKQLMMSGGVLDASGGPVTLTSDGANEAFVTYVDDNVAGGDGTLDGTIQGDLIKQRELQGPANWYFIGSPASTGANDTFTEFFEQGTGTNDLWLQGFSGSDAANADPSLANLRLYDETISGPDGDGFVAVGDAANAMESGRGYIIYPFGDDDRDGTVEASEQYPKMLDSDLEPYNDIAFDFDTDGPGISVTDNGETDGGTNQGSNGQVDSEEGWNLFSNPYLATIDWDDMTRTNLDGSVYVHDPVNGVYISWSSGAQTGSLDEGFIAPQQAFYTKVSNGTSIPGTYGLSIDDITQVQADTSDFFQKSSFNAKPPAVAFRATLDGMERSAYVALVEDASFEKDPNDAYKLGAPVSDVNGVFSLFTMLPDGTGLDINAIPRTLSEETVIPMEATTQGCSNGFPYGGTVTLTWPEIRNFPSEVGLELRDTKNDTVVDLREQNEYNFEVSADTDCSGGQAKATTSELPPTPSPTIVKHDVSKASTGARLQLIMKPNGVLPVELTNFSGRSQGQSVAFNWSTASETNNAGFIIQQKVDGTFSDVSPLIEGAGTSTQPVSYDHTVEGLSAGTHAFRLKQKNLDGTTSFSEPIDVKVGLAGDYTLNAYPNPFRGRATVEFAVKESQRVTIEIYNTLGQRVQTLYQDTPRAEDTAKVSLDARDLSSGLYIVRMRGESFSTTQTLTLVK